MSAHYSKFYLNVHRTSPYFHAHLPPDYPLDKVIMACRAYRRLPPNLRELSELSAKWKQRVWGTSTDENTVDGWYDEDGSELNPSTGKKLTDKEIDAEWERLGPIDIDIEDIPIPEGGFANPDTWEPEPEGVGLCDRSELTEEGIVNDVASLGLERTAREYGIPSSWLPRIKNGKDMARAVLGMHGKPWPSDGDSVVNKPVKE